MAEEKVAGELSHFRIKDRAPVKNDKLRTELAFDVEYDDPEDEGKTKTGTFVARRPTDGMNSNARVSEARLNGGQELGLDRDTLLFHRYLAYCFTVLKETPAWWNPEGSYDSEPLKKVYEHVRHWESSFRPKRVG